MLVARLECPHGGEGLWLDGIKEWIGQWTDMEEDWRRRVEG